MLLDFVLVTMTKNLLQQLNFYKNVLGLELICENQDTFSLGKENRTFLILRKDNSEDSHHLFKHKGPQILTFKCEGTIDHYIEKIKTAGFKVRDILNLPEHSLRYLFVEDYDGNEICLEFS